MVFCSITDIIGLSEDLFLTAANTADMSLIYIVLKLVAAKDRTVTFRNRCKYIQRIRVKLQSRFH